MKQQILHTTVHITQDVKYDFKLNISDINKLILHIDTRNGMYISEEELVGTIVDAEGKPVQLKDVSVEFIGNALYGINQEQFKACDLRVKYSSKLQEKKVKQ